MTAVSVNAQWHGSLKPLAISRFVITSRYTWIERVPGARISSSRTNHRNTNRCGKLNPYVASTSAQINHRWRFRIRSFETTVADSR
jgi:hypothetical protein